MQVQMRCTDCNK